MDIRLAGFDCVRRLKEICDDLTVPKLKSGFLFRGEPIRLVKPGTRDRCSSYCRLGPSEAARLAEVSNDRGPRPWQGNALPFENARNISDSARRNVIFSDDFITSAR
jgi:hypothetical protein